MAILGNLLIFLVLIVSCADSIVRCVNGGKFCADGTTCSPCGQYCSLSGQFGSSGCRCIDCTPSHFMTEDGDCSTDLKCKNGTVCATIEKTQKCVPKEIEVCDNYLDMEIKTQCGFSGYSINYGFKYCRRFFREFEDFSQNGQTAVKCIGRCLVEKIKGFNYGKNQCEQLKNDSLKSHEDCYDQCQFAKLPFKDVLKFIHIIDSDDFWEGPVFKLAGSWIYQTFSDFLSLEWLILLFSN